MSLRSKNKVSANFSMSSMTDIVFLLLIFFMLTSTLVSPNALKLLLPNSKARTLEKQTISVSITPEIEYYIEDQKFPFDQLENQLKQRLANEQEPAIVLHADKTVDIEFAVKVMDIAYRNKYKVVLATNPK
ncbi:MAG: ExbD/TolR family protein [Flavobacteriales bacterium]|jgi:biopolymer transport protein ExbD|nr:biopolymer transporter ExbD [Crocinitomicaceae bacterium]NDG53421.1 biopolymer transporter ExbD [Flavobacteriia bacterium]HAP30529.1 biopolymer transporter ExbD [Flavobacteriales bacterium]|tara:strand:+ start:327 stop:719 length:393 start_codon:yes stop_codon:yes gene_type:complete